MSTLDTVVGLARFERRGPGTDAERRAGRWLCDELTTAGREARLEPFWCRPNWALTAAWHVGLALIGSLVSVSSARVGGALLLVALLSVIADAVSGRSLGRRLTPERASQNVVSEGQASVAPVRLVITANYDAGRAGFAYRPELRRAAARLNAALGGISPGWLGWLTIAIVWLLAVAVARLEGSKGTAIGLLQLVPTVGLVIGLALLLELAGANHGPAAGDNGSGVAAAIALARALDAGPPSHAAVDIVLQGASDVTGTGLRSYLRVRRKTLNATNTVVLGIAPTGAGELRWWFGDGSLVPLRYFAQLRRLCEQVATEESHFEAKPHRGRGASPALPARAARLPAIAIGALDPSGIAPRSHRSTDTHDTVDKQTIDSTVQFGLLLVDAIDGYLAELAPRRSASAVRRA
jgi:hypothetical protein